MRGPKRAHVRFFELLVDVDLLLFGYLLWQEFARRGSRGLS